MILRNLAGREGFEPSVGLYTRQPLSRRPHSTTLAPPQYSIVSGERGIRTHGGLPHTCFQDRRLKPLGHLSWWAQMLPAFQDSIIRMKVRQETGKNPDKKLSVFDCGFPLKQGLFSFNTPMITRQTAIFLYDSVARDCNCNFIGSTGSGDSANCLWRTH